MSLTALIDTNVFMVALSPRSNLHWLFQRFIRGEFRLAVSNDILLEYEEQLRIRYGADVVAEFLLILSEAPHVLHVEPFYKWNLIQQDPDDNKFVDCAIAAAADYLITHDRHFDAVKRIDFPAMNIITAFEFQAILEKQQ